jgi:hypothetical protein
MSAWTLALVAVGQVIALGVLVLGIGQTWSRHLDRRFEEMDRVRQVASEHWDERFDLRDRLIDELTTRINDNLTDHALLRKELTRLQRELNDLRVRVAQDYVTRETYLETVAGVHIKLDKLADRLFQQQGVPA